MNLLTSAVSIPISLLCLGFWLGGLCPAWSCAVPVFRYALERWPPAPYQLIVVDPERPDAEQQAVLNRLKSVPGSRDAEANLAVHHLDPQGNPVAALPPGLGPLPTTNTPALVLCYPAGAENRGVVWSGGLTQTNLDQLLESPARRRLVQHLVRGDCAVWVLLESGDPASDDAAARLLQTRIEHLEKTLTLPKPDFDDSADQPPAAATNELKIAFSLLRLSRNDPAETVFVRTLLGLEDDLADAREPIAFPVFGRGRALYALVGKGINNETIDEACAHLVGACSCIVKEENPGLDLLLSAPWDDLVRPILTSISEASELTGFPSVADVSPRTNPPQAALESAAAATGLPTRSSATNWVLSRTLMITGGLGALFLISASLWLWFRQG